MGWLLSALILRSAAGASRRMLQEARETSGLSFETRAFCPLLRMKAEGI
jgi:hypothetical protein